jgi:HSP20 family molecular chaperone IbpA
MQKKKKKRNKKRTRSFDNKSNKRTSKRQRRIMTTQFKVEPLTKEQQASALAVREAYGSFWNNVTFTKQWDLFPFTRDEVEDLLTMASEIVVRIRSHLDARSVNLGPKLRMLDGCAREFFFAYDERNHPQQNPRKFVRDLVHATFHDAASYVEELAGDELDVYVTTALDYIESVAKQQRALGDDGHELAAKINTVWQRNANIMAKIWPADVDEREQLFTARNVGNMKRLLTSLYSTEHALKQIGLENARIESEEHVLVDALNDVGDDVKQKQVVDDAKQVIDDDNQVPDLTSSRGDEEPFVPPPLARGKSGVFQIEKLKSRVDELATEVSTFKGEVANLSREQFLSNGAEQGAKQVEALQRTCQGYTEDLMQGLLSLDEIVGSADIRPERKRQVLAIQGLLDDVDVLNNKLRDLRGDLKQQAEVEKQQSESESESESSGAAASSSTADQDTQKRVDKEKDDKEKDVVGDDDDDDEQIDDESAASAVIRDDDDDDDESSSRSKSLESYWRSMKLDPDWKTREHRDHYAVSAFVPGLVEDETTLELSDRSQSFTIAGVRLPSAEEEQLLREQLRRRYRYPPEHENKLVLRTGAGRFGKFRSTFRLPTDAVADNISARYERGALHVTIPRRASSPLQQRPRFARQMPAHSQRQQRRSPFAMGSTPFFGDSDVFW